MYIRYFARTDESSLGRAAAAYCAVLRNTGLPVRLCSTRVAELQLDRAGKSTSVWDKHRDLLITPMNGSFVNVICGEPADWLRFHTPSVPNALLLAGANVAPEVPQPLLMEALTLYRYVFVQSSELAEIMHRVTGYQPLVADPGTIRGALNAPSIHMGGAA